MQPSHCPNCKKEVAQGFAYCPHCGQAAHLHRLNAHHLVHEAVHYFTHSDKGIFHLVKALALRPGQTARAYIEGRRKAIFSPINFFFIVAGVVVFFLTAVQKPDSNPRVIAMRQTAQQIKDPVAKKNLLATARRVETVGLITSKYANIISMLSTPLLSFFLWIFYRRNRFNYIEHLVANMYFIAFTVLVYAIILTPLRALLPQAGTYLLYTYFLFEIVYRSFAYYHFIQKYSTAGIIKAISVSSFVVLFWIAFSTFFIVSYIQTGLWGWVL